MNRFFNYSVAIASAVLFLSVSGCSYLKSGNKAVDPPAALMTDPTWPQADSDLAVDPAIVFGRLDNGVRFILKENKTPRDRVSMHLCMQVGSLVEGDSEQGITHFIEHMLFDGTTHFPPGEMVKYFQRIGMQFGPDANAHTGFSQTVYDVLLPKGDRESLSEGLQVLQDYAVGALLLPDQIEKERKIILAEKRSRDSGGFRAIMAAFKFEMPGSIVPERFPIGTEQAITKIDPAMMRAFYAAWYRPERMTVVLVGDFDAATARALIEERFGGLEGRGEPRKLPSFGRFSHTGLQTFYYYNKEAGAANIRIETMEQKPLPADTVEFQRKELVRDLAFDIVRNRLDKLVKAPDSHLNSADIIHGHYLRQVRYSEITAQSKPEEWRAVLSCLEQELRAALQFGFTEFELARAKREYLARLERDAQESQTRQSQAVAEEITYSLDSRRVIQSARQRKDLLTPMVKEVSLEQAHQAFVDCWSAPHRLVLVTGNVQISADPSSPEEQIAAAYRQSSRIAVKTPVDRKGLAFPYLAEPTRSGGIVSRANLADLGIEQVRFENNCRLNVKKTAFKENQVSVALAFGTGLAGEPQGKPGLAMLTQDVVNESGFGAMDRMELEDALAGHNVDFHLELREDMFLVRAESTKSELPLLFQILRTFVMDPGYRREALQLVRKQLNQKYQSYSCNVDGLVRLKAQRFLASGDERFGLPDWKEVQQRTLSEIREWFGAQLSSNDLEVSVVGDVEPEEAVKLAALYIGSLPGHEETVVSPGRPGPEFPRGQTLRLTADTDISKSLVMVAYPTDDFWDVQRTRRLSVLGDIISERLRVQVREKLGAAYSPYAFNRSYRAFKGYGFLESYMHVEPSKADTIVSEIHRIADSLLRNGVSPDEFRRALDPTITQIKDLRQSNDYWLYSVLVGSGRNPQQLDWSRTMESDYKSISDTEINTLARKYLDNEKAVAIIIQPEHVAAK